MRHLFTLILLAACLQAAPWSPATVDGFTPSLMRGLVAYWKLDEASGTRYDAWTNAINLTDNNTVTSASGILTTGAVFTAATSEFLSVADPAAMTHGSNWSWSFWYNMTLSNDKTFIGKWDYQTDGEYAMQTGTVTEKTNDIVIYIATSATDDGSGSKTKFTNCLLAASWNHVVVTFDGTQATAINRLKVYHNGTNVNATQVLGTIPTTIRNSAAVFNLGKFGGTLPRYFNGSMDESGMWRRTISPDEAKLLHNLGKARRFPFNSGP